MFLNQGECCCALTRLIVHDKVYAEFVRKFVAGAMGIRVGMPRGEDTRMDPLVHPDHLKSGMASSLEQMVELANDTHYGLAASVWTTNLKTAHTIAPQIKAGTVWFSLHNFVFPSAPYGGFGASGVGSELGKQGLLAMTRTKNAMLSPLPGGFKWY